MRKSGELTNRQVAGAKVTVVEGVRDAVNQDGAVLLDIERGVCLSLNVVGAKIWQMLKQHLTGDQIIACLAQDFVEVPPAQLELDYVDFIGQLETNKLARVVVVSPAETDVEEAPIQMDRKLA
jgi:hypothetical protein